MSHNYNSIPQDMRDAHRWVCRMGKIPINPATLCGAKTTDATTWGSFEEAAAAQGKTATVGNKTGKVNGVGFVLGDGWAGIDLDTVRDPKTGETAEDAARILDSFSTYTEVSPSGYGYHVFIHVRDDVKLAGNKYKLEPNGISRPAEHGKDKEPEIEIYTSGRYFTVTGEACGRSSFVAHYTDEVQQLSERYAAAAAAIRATAAASGQTSIPLTLADNDVIAAIRRGSKAADFARLYDRGNTAGNGGDRSRADVELCGILAFYTGKDAAQMDRIFRASALMRRKWDERHGAESYGAMTINTAIANCGAVYNPAEYRSSQSDGGYPLDWDLTPLTDGAQQPAELPPMRGESVPLAQRIKCAADVEPTRARFLWKPYLPLGEYTLCMAAGGTGKTMLCCAIAAAVSSGEELFGDELIEESYFNHAPYYREPANALFISAEDDAGTLSYRLKASGADMSRCLIVDNTDSLGLAFDDAHFADFRELVLMHRPRLVIIDPWHAFLGAKVDINRVNEVRPVLQRLQNLARECDCAMILISHVNKKSQSDNLNNAAIGSADLVNAARSAFTVIYPNPKEEPDTRLLVHTKSNHAAVGQSLEYVIKDGGATFTGYSDITKTDIEQAARHNRTLAEMRELAAAQAVSIDSLMNAIREITPSDGTVVHMSYAEMRERFGAGVFGGMQPKRALEEAALQLSIDGFTVQTGKNVKYNGSSVKGFSTMRTMPDETEE